MPLWRIKIARSHGTYHFVQDVSGDITPKCDRIFENQPSGHI